jgi:cyclophilin family peptidyl-prolyl cis-trans isomerase
VFAGIIASPGCDELFNALPGGSGGSNIFNPTTDPDPLTVVANDSIFSTVERTETLTAEASGGVPPYFYRWNVEQVPDDPEDLLDGMIPIVINATQPEVETLPFEVGRYVYRVRVTDSAGTVETAFVIIDVGPTPLEVEIVEANDEGDPLTRTASEPFTLTVEANMGDEFTFAWRQLDGPDVEFENEDEATVRITAIEPGQIRIGVTVFTVDTPPQGDTADILIDIESGDSFLVRVDTPDLLLQNEPGTLLANLTNDSIDADSLDYEWEILSNVDADLSSPNSRETSLVSRSLTTVNLRVTASGMVNSTFRSATQDVGVVVLPDLKPEFRMIIKSANEEVNGQIIFELDAESAPKTVANIVRYIDAGFYTNVLFHRLALDGGDPFVTQFGGFTVDDEEEGGVSRKDPIFDPVESENESTIGNTRSTVGLALTGGNPNSGTSQIFINVKDNTFLDNQGFTAFGTIVEGMDLVDLMFDFETDAATVDGGSTISDVPVVPITIADFRRFIVTEDSDRPEGFLDENATGNAFSKTAPDS